MKSTKTKRTGVLIAEHPNHLFQPTRQVFRAVFVLMLALGCLIALSAQAQSNYPLPYNFNTFAGNAYGGNGTGNQAIFNNPYATAVDSAGNVYVADTSNSAVRKITAAGVVTTLAGTPGVTGSADGTGSAARFYSPFGIAVDSAGNLYVTDLNNHTIRKITPAGVVTTVAGAAGVIGSTDGSGSAARFHYPAGIAVDSVGNVYVADTYNYTIRKITSAGSVSTFAGTAGVYGSANGTGSAALFSFPNGVAVGGENVYVA